MSKYRTFRFFGLCRVLLAFSLFALPTLVSIGEVRAQGQPLYSASHLLAAQRFAKAIGMTEDTVIPIRRFLLEIRATDPANAQKLEKSIEPLVAEDALAAAFAPVIASQLSERVCDSLATYWESPPGQKVRASQRQLALTGRYEDPVFTPKELQQNATFEQTAEFAELMRAMPAIETKIRELSKGLKEQIQTAARAALGARR